MPDSTTPDHGDGHHDPGGDERLLDALGAEVERIGALGDPVEIVRQVGRLHALLREAIDDPLSHLRLDAVGALRAQGWSYDQIAARCSMSKERAAQLSREARSRRD